MHYFFRFLAVLAAFLNALSVGAPLAPFLRIFSLEPAAILFFFALMLAYKPLLLGIVSPRCC